MQTMQHLDVRLGRLAEADARIEDQALFRHARFLGNGAALAEEILHSFNDVRPVHRTRLIVHDDDGRVVFGCDASHRAAFFRRVL